MWPGTLRENSYDTPVGRAARPSAVLQRLLRGRITFTPAGDGYTFQAETRYDRIFAGVAAPVPAWIRPGDVRGTEHIGPEDTPEADYG